MGHGGLSTDLGWCFVFSPQRIDRWTLWLLVICADQFPSSTHTHMFLEGWHFQVGGIGKACSMLTHTLMFFNNGCCHRSGRLCLKVWGSTVFCLSPDPTNHLDVWRVLDPSPNQCIGWGSHSAGPCAFPSKEANRLVKGIGAKKSSMPKTSGLHNLRSVEPP